MSTNYPTITDDWTIATTEFNGARLLLRVNQGAAVLAQHPDFAEQVGVVAILNAPREDGSPTWEEGDALKVLEHELVSALQADNAAVFVMAITAPGNREFVFYSRDSSVIVPRVTEVAQRVGTHNVQITERPDPQWEIFTTFGGIIAPPGASAH